MTVRQTTTKQKEYSLGTRTSKLEPTKPCGRGRCCLGFIFSPHLEPAAALRRQMHASNCWSSRALQVGLSSFGLARHGCQQSSFMLFRHGDGKNTRTCFGFRGTMYRVALRLVTEHRTCVHKCLGQGMHQRPTIVPSTIGEEDPSAQGAKLLNMA